ncbi:probable serine hydrolase [Lucilia sericata]|uniref:probable serine hydrolase n=1 Tax=Lucilia sericata TaxID=13632 RepID=UPI0018A85C64|nr:probable serine hydrolase [Lucilia sericata]XP_037826096.1 probable serine hydrolase [Lucilia sericata]
MNLKNVKHEDINISVPWGHIAGRWYGNRSVRPILALHGWQDNLGTWDRLIPLLPQHIGMMCIDFPGHGRSSKYPNGITYHMIDYVDTILLIMKEYNWKKVSILGHSLGGIIGFIYTSLYPQTVDMLIQLDIIMTPIRSPDYRLKKLVMGTEKLLIENERLERLNLEEPPSYFYEELEEKLYLGSNKSIEKENCKYLLNRSINASQLNPGKYYFSRDGRIKYYHEFNPTLELIEIMTKRLKSVNHLVIKFNKSDYIENYMLDLVRKNHLNMEFNEVEGTHHAHLNNPKEVAAKIVPFILRFMPETDMTTRIQSKL